VRASEVHGVPALEVPRLERRYRDHLGHQLVERLPQPVEIVGREQNGDVVSRLNSAAPYSTHAWPPISRLLTRCERNVERTLRIGLGVKRAT
jgi:hypothetical protein